MLKAELAFKAEAQIGEGALWDSERELLYWIDISNGEIHLFNPADGADRLVANVGQYIGTVVQRAGGGLLAAMQRGLYFVNEDGALTQICDPEKGKPRNRFNDGKCDPAGRFWAGTMPIDCMEPKVGSLYRLDSSLTVTKMLDGITISNGIIWSPDHKTMYYADTPTGVVEAFDYDINSGDISNRRTVIRIANGEGGPDGITIDSEGMLWVAQWGGWKVGRYDPADGKLLDEVRVPAAQVSSCAFGGSNLDELFITTARIGITEANLKSQPLAGSLYRVKTAVKGLKADKFKG